MSELRLLKKRENQKMSESDEILFQRVLWLAAADWHIELPNEQFAADLRKLLEVSQAFASRYGLRQWPSAKRMDS
jgi:hypothetical protein